MHGEDGKFSDMEYENKNLIPTSEDAIGRTLWALGHLINNSNNEELIEKAKGMFDKSYELIEEDSSPRAKAFTVIGLYHYYKKYNDEKHSFKDNFSC